MWSIGHKFPERRVVEAHFNSERGHDWVGSINRRNRLTISLRQQKSRTLCGFSPSLPRKICDLNLMKNPWLNRAESATKPLRETLLHPSPGIAPTGIHVWFSAQTHFEDKTVYVACI